MTQLVWWTEGGKPRCTHGNDSTWGGKSHRLCVTVTYKRLGKAFFEEDAGRAHDVVQHVTVLHQHTDGIVEWPILHILLFLCLRLQTPLAYCPPLSIHCPLQRQTKLLFHSSNNQTHSLHDWLKHNHIFQGARLRPSVVQSREHYTECVCKLALHKLLIILGQPSFLLCTHSAAVATDTLGNCPDVQVSKAKHRILTLLILPVILFESSFFGNLAPHVPKAAQFSTLFQDRASHLMWCFINRAVPKKQKQRLRVGPFKILINPNFHQISFLTEHCNSFHANFCLQINTSKIVVFGSVVEIFMLRTLILLKGNQKM